MLSSTGRGVRDEVDTRPVRRIQDRQAEIGRTSLARSQAGLDRADKSDQTALGDPFALDSGSGLTPELSRAATWCSRSGQQRMRESYHDAAKRRRLERIVRPLLLHSSEEPVVRVLLVPVLATLSGRFARTLLQPIRD